MKNALKIDAVGRGKKRAHRKVRGKARRCKGTGRAADTLSSAWGKTQREATVRVEKELKDGMASFIIPEQELKNHLVLMGGGKVYKVAVDSGSQAENAAEDFVRLLRLMPQLPATLSKRAAKQSKERMESWLDALLEVDPFAPTEAEIDLKNASMRAEFLEDFPVLDSAGVHELAGLKGSNKSQQASTWRRKGRVLGLPVRGKNAYPKFQFNADGQPFPLMKPVLSALPQSFTPWQRAFWFVSPKVGLDGQTPVDSIRAGDERVIEVARCAGETVAG